MTDYANPSISSAETPDLEVWLEQRVGATGHVEAVYGGFEITVSDGDAFPWASVLHRLLESDHDVWVEVKDGRLVIVTQSSID